MKVGLNQPITREVLGKLMSSTESDGWTESVTEDRADNYQITRKQPVKRAKKGPKKFQGKVVSKIINHRVIESKAKVVVTSLAEGLT